MDELKPCPFCRAELFEGRNIHRKDTMRHPYNTNCPLSEAEFLDSPGFRKRWNRRAEPENKALLQTIKDANELIQALISKAEPNPCEWCTGKNCSTCCLCTQNDEDDCNFSLAVDAAEPEGSEHP